jgi:hypothetical protein
MDLQGSPGCPGYLAGAGILGSRKAGAGTVFPASAYWPKTTACMILPGKKVNSPAMMSAPKKIEVIALR